MTVLCLVRAGLAVGGMAAAIGCGSVVKDEDAPSAADARPTFDAPPGVDAPPGSFHLAVAPSGNGVARVSSNPPGIDCPGDCDEDYPADTIVTLSAATDVGSSFGGWSGSGCSGVADCTVAMTAMRQVSAAFTCDAGTATFNFTGGVQSFTAFSCMTSVVVDARGASGGAAAFDAMVFGAGGRGGRTEATLAITPGETLLVFVGGQGATGVPETSAAGGFNGGGAGGFHSPGQAGGGGGGASDIRRGAGTLADRIVVASGGGGAASCSGAPYDGGAGGGLAGASPPIPCDSVGVIPTGGTQSGGGAGGSYMGYCTAAGGALGLASAGCSPAGSGGGGGGLYGGGGGAWNGGGGGSSFAESSATGVTLTPDANAGPGSVVLRW